MVVFLRTLRTVLFSHHQAGYVPGRTPHIHVAVSKNGRRILTTQMLVNGHPQNARDGVARNVQNPLALETIMGVFKPLEGSKLGELTVNFDIVLGVTAFEDDQGKLRGGIAPSNLLRG